MLYPKSVIACLAGAALLNGCTSDSADQLYPTNDEAAQVIYDQQLKTIIEDKCISCHLYHLEGANRYDSFDKTKSSIGQMVERITATSNIVMPPAESSQLTEDEKLVFQEFLDVLNSDGGVPPAPVPGSLGKVQVNWTAYKYADSLQRSGVGGSFDSISYTLNTEASGTIDILQDATVTIATASVNIDGNDGLRTTNVKDNFFSVFSPKIEGRVISYSDTEARIRFSMNAIEREIPFQLQVVSDTLKLKGTIPDMNVFGWKRAYEMLELVCGEFHENKVWPDIELEASILLE